MSVATATATKVQSSIDQKTISVFGTIAISASPATYAAGGLTLDLSKIVVAPSVPLEVRIYSKSAPVSGYVYAYAPGSNQTNGKIQVLESAGSAAPLAEIAASAIPAGVSGDTIGFTAVFLR